MIDPTIFNLPDLIETLLDHEHGNRNKWWHLVEIVKDNNQYKVKCKTSSEGRYSYLRHSRGPRQGHFWDMYGDNYLTPTLALIALLAAPVPPPLLRDFVWKG